MMWLYGDEIRIPRRCSVVKVVSRRSYHTHVDKKNVYPTRGDYWICTNDDAEFRFLDVEDFLLKYLSRKYLLLALVVESQVDVCSIIYRLRPVIDYAVFPLISRLSIEAQKTVSADKVVSILMCQVSTNWKFFIFRSFCCVCLIAGKAIHKFSVVIATYCFFIILIFGSFLRRSHHKVCFYVNRFSSSFLTRKSKWFLATRRSLRL